MSQNLMLLPLPRSAHFSDSKFVISSEKLILINSPMPQSLQFVATYFQRVLEATTGINWQITASAASPTEQIGLSLILLSGPALHPQGYKLEIATEGITVSSQDEAGIYYGICTLIQILELSIREEEPLYSLPCLNIDDWPDFPVRGVMLDISRDKVPTMETLFDLVDMLASWKINQLQLYIEHTFAYRNHSDVWANSSPITGQEILELDAYCRDRYMELVPQQQSGGHMHRWLVHERYASLAETHERFMAPWGELTQGPFSLCPIDPGSLDLIRHLYDELLPHFTSRTFNVCCDEMADIGFGRSKETSEKIGVGRIYLEYLKKVYREVKSRGYTMQFWGDMIVKYPDLISELPMDLIALEWGYEENHPFEDNCDLFASSNIPFYVCPGTSSWGSLAGRTDNAIGNLLNSATAGIKYCAIGYLITDWGDYGHWQVLPVSYLGFATGAAYSWALEANRNLNIRRTISWHAFRDRTSAMGNVAYDLGNIYKTVGFEPFCSSALFWILLQPQVKSRFFPELPKTDFQYVESAIDQAMTPLTDTEMERPDADLIIDEYKNTARLLRHACRRGLLLRNDSDVDMDNLRSVLDADMKEIIAEHKRIWLERNRPGGLDDSVKRFEATRVEYSEGVRPSAFKGYYLSSQHVS